MEWWCRTTWSCWHRALTPRRGPDTIEKSRIQETKNLSTDADSSTDTEKILLVRQNLQKNYFFFALQFYTLYEKKFSNLRQLLSITFPQGFQKNQKKFGHWTLGSGDKKTVKRSEKVWHINTQGQFFEKTPDQRPVNLSGADFLPEQRGCAASQEWSRSISQARDDNVRGVGKHEKLKIATPPLYPWSIMIGAVQYSAI